jgi:hypothetical protein
MPIYGLPPAIDHPLWPSWLARSYAADAAPNSVPKFLHHYVPSFEVMRSIIDTQTLWATEMHGVNDDKEFDHGLPAVLAALHEVGDPDLREHVELISGGLRERFLHEVFVSCLSTSRDIESQWTDYADSQRGFAITFDNLVISALDAPNGLRLLPVEYDETIQSARARRVVALAEADLRAVPDARRSVEYVWAVQSRFTLLATELYFLCACFKAAKWRHEREWRLIYSRQVDDSVGLPIRVRRSGSREQRHVEIDLTRRFAQHHAPTFVSVCAGPKTSHHESEMARDYVRSHRPGVAWYTRDAF